MQLDFTDLTTIERYHALTQSIIPRPIAWILTENSNGSYNLAPFSFFTAVCSDPPLVLFSVGKKAEGEETGQLKDTRRNIMEREEFVIHMPSSGLINAVQDSAATLLHDESEVAQLGLATTEFDNFNLPRLSDCAIAMACRLHRIDEVGNVPHAVIYGEVLSMHIDDSLLNDQNRIDPVQFDPLAKLGGKFYAPLGELMQPKS